MTHVGEEYKVNRLRGLIQMVQTADRQSGRGQTPWVQRELVKELMSSDPCLEVVQEVGVVVEDTSGRYSAWNIQNGVQRGGETTTRQMDEDGVVVRGKVRKGREEVSAEVVRVQGIEVPSHLVRWYERQGNTLDDALVAARDRMLERERLMGGDRKPKVGRPGGW